MSILVTGVAGFLGLHVAEALLARGERIVGVDPLAVGYDPALRTARLRRLDGRPGFAFRHGDFPAVADDDAEIAAVIHLAAPPARVCGHLDVLDWCRDRLPAFHLVYPSAAPDDLLARAYAKLHRLPQTALRIGAVYGPWGRPDAAYFALADAIVAGRPVTFAPDSERRLLEIEDAVAGILAALDHPPADDGSPHRLLDLAGDPPVELDWLVTVLEDSLGRTVERRRADWAAEAADAFTPDLAATEAALDWRPTTGIEAGLARFAAWHRDHYGARAGRP